MMELSVSSRLLPRTSSDPTMILPGPLTESFLQLCQKVREFLEEQTQREKSGLPLAGSLERTPAGELCVRKQLPVGLILLATPNPQDPKTSTLLIFFDPPRFRAWKKSMGPLKMVYMNPYDIELVRDQTNGRWGLFLDQKELHMDLKSDEIYEVARLEIQDGIVYRTR